jgi:hypothetical protein
MATKTKMAQAVVCACSVSIREDRVGVEIDYCPLHKAAPELLKSLKETREVAAACFRAMVEMGCVEAVIDRMPHGMEDTSRGFGKRAGDAIKKAEGGL